MLFCVGSFFSNTPECSEQWCQYVEGKEEGIIYPRLRWDGLSLQTVPEVESLWRYFVSCVMFYGTQGV